MKISVHHPKDEQTKTSKVSEIGEQIHIYIFYLRLRITSKGIKTDKNILDGGSKM